MSSDRTLPGCAPLRRALLCLLLLGLLLHGHAGVLRQLLGPAHWHAPAAPAGGAAAGTVWPGWLEQALAWRQQLQARSPWAAGHGLPGQHAADGGHHHSDTARHHHAGHDHGMVAVDSGSSQSDPLADTLAGSLLQPLGLATHPGWHGAVSVQPGWLRPSVASWRSASARLPERPPRA